MKKLTALLIAAIMLVSFAGCKGDENTTKNPTGEIVGGVGDNAMLVNNMTVSKEQFSYYYTSSYNYYAQIEKNYNQQGISMGFDLKRAPDEVMSGQTDGSGKELTWSDVITEHAKVSAKNNFAFYAEATASGYTLTSEDEERINQTLESIDQYAAAAKISTDQYIDTYIAKGLDRDGVKKLLEIEAVAMAYEDIFRDKVYAGITDEQIVERYNQNPVKYKHADISCFRLAIPETEQAEGETDREFQERYDETVNPIIDAANEIADSATSISAFEEAVEKHEDGEITDHEGILYDTAETTFSQEAADWIFASARSQGDVEIFKTETSVFVIYVENPVYTGMSTDVRHCLIAFDADDPKNPTQSEKQEAYDIASGLLADLKVNGITEEKFTDMVKENSDDKESVSDGGLFENITINAGYIEKFEKWSLDPERKVGDCEIIETEYGYHIVYFVENNGEDWRETVRTELKTEAYDEAANALVGDGGKYQITVNDAVINEAAKEFCDGIRNKKINYAY